VREQSFDLSSQSLAPVLTTEPKQLRDSVQITSCRRAGGRHDMPPPRPASGDTIYVMYAHG